MWNLQDDRSVLSRKKRRDVEKQGSSVERLGAICMIGRWLIIFKSSLVLTQALFAVFVITSRIDELLLLFLLVILHNDIPHNVPNGVLFTPLLPLLIPILALKFI
jgi:hypothetical protein